MPSNQPIPLFTVFVPTFNRADTLAATLDSIAAQSFRDFEILVVDDGSTDGTDELVAAWTAKHDVPLRYVYQENQGKHVAYNRAAEEARGELVVLVDSDDLLCRDALEVLAREWRAIPEAERSGFAGVEGLCRDSSGRLHGQPFPREDMVSDYLEMTRRYGVRGEKRHAIRTDVLRRYPYPVVPGERHVRPSFAWKRIAHDYRFRYVNHVLQVVDFRPGGLTRTASRRRLKYPGGLYVYWLDDLLHHPQYQSRSDRAYSGSQVIRYGLLSGHGLREQWRVVPGGEPRSAWLRGLPHGVTDYVLDRLKRRRLRRRGEL